MIGADDKVPALYDVLKVFERSKHSEELLIIRYPLYFCSVAESFLEKKPRGRLLPSMIAVEEASADKTMMASGCRELDWTE